MKNCVTPLNDCFISNVSECLEWHLHVFPKHGKPYINRINQKCLDYFDWPLTRGTSCSGRVLNRLQILLGIESSRKNIFCVQFQVQELTKMIEVRVKIKVLNIRLFYILLLKIKLRYICTSLHILIN